MKKIKYLELLAPAQNKECAMAAIDCGADSVYIGAKFYGARKNAGNSLSDIEDIINYAHKFGVKIYITLNTILDDKELKGAVELIKELHKIKADGIIIQDFGILNEANAGNLPDIKLIASTQCDIRNAQKVKFFENTGIKRVILARELSIDKIKEISQNTDIEIETFIHGALCVSYSGQCYLSHKIGGRSANRGECAQACRKKYSLLDKSGKVILKDKHLLSMKDFMASSKLEELIDAGVTSFKIEGRLKDVNYIKNTVLYYRNLLDKIIERRSDEGFRRLSFGKTFSCFEPDLKKSFNRDFCTYFLNGRKENICNPDTPNSKGEFLGTVEKAEGNYFTLKLSNKIKINPQDGLCYTDKNGVLSGFLANKTEGEKIFPNIMPKISNEAEIYRNRDAYFENALKTAEIKRKLRVDFKIFDGYIEAVDETNTCAAAEFINTEEAKNIETTEKSWINAFNKTGDSIFYTGQVEFLSDKIYFLPISRLNELRREILEKLAQKRIEEYKTETQEKIKTAKFPAESGDYRLNVHNKKAEEFYNKCGCRVKEYSFESGISAKGKELMRTKHCIRHMLNMCLKNNPKYKEGLFLKDEAGAKYGLEFDCKNCEMVVKSL